MSLGGFHVFIDQEEYNGYEKLTNQSEEVGRNLSVSKTEENCLQVSFPSTMSVNFCEKKEMLSFVVTPADVYKNTTKACWVHGTITWMTTLHCLMGQFCRHLQR